MCLQLLPQNSLWVTRSKVPHLSLVVVFASHLYFAAEVLAYYGETDCEVFWLRQRDAWEEGKRKKSPFFLSAGMNVAGFPPIFTKFILSSRNCDHWEKISSFQFSVISQRFLGGKDKETMFIHKCSSQLKTRWKETVFIFFCPFTFSPNPMFSLILSPFALSSCTAVFSDLLRCKLPTLLSF